MDASYCSPLQLQENNPFLFDCDALLLEKTCAAATYDPVADPGYFSACSSLSPTSSVDSSVDSFSFSPSSLQGLGSGQEALDCFVFRGPAVKQEPQTLACPSASSSSSAAPGSTTTTTAGAPAKKSRSRYPGKKRHTASEREKLRMRDLTKAMHHLRAYLPSSVAPAGQTLTKIETLRLTLRYISYLSSQLGLSEETLAQRGSSTGAVTDHQSQTLTQILGHPASSYSPQEAHYNPMEAVDEACTYQQNLPAGQFSTLQHSYLVPSEACYASSAGQEYWMPTQQQDQFHFSGHC